MSTAGNALTGDTRVTEEVSDPTLANADGTLGVTVSDVRDIHSTDDVVGVSWSGSQKVTVNSVSGNTVTVLFESPSGVDAYAAEADGALAGTLTVTVEN